MKFTAQIISIIAIALGATAQSFGQVPAAPAAQQQPDQISQLAQLVGLSEEQETEIRGILAETEPKIEKMQTEVQSIQGELVELAGPDYDEEAIHAKAAELGELEGKMTASSIILQSKIDAVFTEEQRNTLEEMQRKQEEQRRQMQQQQLQRQMQQMQQLQQQRRSAAGAEASTEAAE